MACQCQAKVDEALLHEIAARKQDISLLIAQKEELDEAHKELQFEHEELQKDLDWVYGKKDEAEAKLTKLREAEMQSTEEEVKMLEEQMTASGKAREALGVHHAQLMERKEALEKKLVVLQRGMSGNIDVLQLMMFAGLLGAFVALVRYSMHDG